jgi:DNA-binding NarL/FixJ family response regulator
VTAARGAAEALDVSLAHPLRVVVAGPETARSGIRAAVERARLALVAECGDGVTATAAVVRERAQLCLVDAALPGARQAVAAIASLPLAPKVVVIGSAADADALFAAFECGASGYVTPDLEPASLAEELQSAADGGLALTPAVAARFAEAARPLAPGRLTDRERKVLELLAAGLTTAEIGLRLRVSSAAVRRHVSSAVGQIIASDRGSARS